MAKKKSASNGLLFILALILYAFFSLSRDLRMIVIIIIVTIFFVWYLYKISKKSRLDSSQQKSFTEEIKSKLNEGIPKSPEDHLSKEIELGDISIFSAAQSADISISKTSKQRNEYSLNQSFPDELDDFTSVTLKDKKIRTDYRIPEPSKPNKYIEWITPGKQVVIAGLVLPGGMIYISSTGSDYLGAPVIRKDLNVFASFVDVSLPLLGYWPSYSTISPEARKAYLQWLAGGRKAPDAHIGYVFLFFYGLEQRVLVDANEGLTARIDIAVIKCEIKRLINIYNQNNSFERYARNFLAYIESSNMDKKYYLSEPPIFYKRGYELPLELRIALGQLALDQRPVSAEWAFAWVQTDPNISFRMPAIRCAEQFAMLFKQEYINLYGEGIVLKCNKTKLQLTYHPASSSLSGMEFKHNNHNIPDITAVKGPIAKLQSLVDVCTEILDPYSRYLGRTGPNKAHALEGLILLPIEIWPEPSRSELNLIKSITFEQGLTVMTFGELCARLKSTAVLPRDKILALAGVLESINIGIEPNVLAGSRLPKPEEDIALFRIDKEATTYDDPAYRIAVITLDLSCAAALADGEVSSDEIITLNTHIDSWGHLDKDQHAHLKAYLQLSIKNPVAVGSLKKNLAQITLDEKHTIARFLAHLAQADGVVSPKEVKFLERIYKMLGVNTQLVYTNLHTSAAHFTGSPEQQGAADFVLDAERIAQLKKETAEVSILLSTIFQEDVSPQPIPTESVCPEEKQQKDTRLILGLDYDHSAFLRLLISRKSWLRSELVDVASDMELMLDGALENINETMLDTFDETLTEGDDPIDINQNITETLPI